LNKKEIFSINLFAFGWNQVGFLSFNFLERETQLRKGGREKLSISCRASQGGTSSGGKFYEKEKFRLQEENEGFSLNTLREIF
jgi:hypothetical protein